MKKTLLFAVILTFLWGGWSAKAEDSPLSIGATTHLYITDKNSETIHYGVDFEGAIYKKLHFTTGVYYGVQNDNPSFILTTNGVSEEVKLSIDVDRLTIPLKLSYKFHYFSVGTGLYLRKIISYKDQSGYNLPVNNLFSKDHSTHFILDVSKDIALTSKFSVEPSLILSKPSNAEKLLFSLGASLRYHFNGK